MFSSRLRRAGRGRFGGWLRVELLEGRVTPTTFVVSNLLDGVVSKAGDLPGSLRQAIFDANANPGADVVDATGVSGTIGLSNGSLYIKDSVTIAGSGTALKIDGKNLTRPFYVDFSSDSQNYLVTISHLAITKGNSTIGGAVYASAYAQLTLDHLDLNNNQASSEGGAVYCSNVLTMTDCTVSLNKAGGLYSSGGGGVQASSKATLTNCNFNMNQSVGSGGGANLSSTATLTNCSFTNNSTSDSSSEGGALRINSTATITNCIISNNTTRNNGGGILLAGKATLVQTNITGNQSTNRYGGGIYHRNDLTIDQCTISNNKCYYSGGGIYGFASKLIITNSTVTGNIANGNSFSRGGGIYVSSSNFQIRNCTISNNLALGDGGGLWASLGVVESSTIVNNKGGRGGGISCNQLTIASSIVADNSATTSVPDVFSTGLITITDCLIGDLTGLAGFNRVGHLLSGSPELGPLANNGGPTMTHLPLPGSRVRNAGSNSVVSTTDQRGQPRLLGNRVDIGAVESADDLPTASATILNVLSGGNLSHSFSVTYFDTDNIDIATVDGNLNAVRVVGPNGFDAPGLFVGIDDPTPGMTRTASYTFNAPGGIFDPIDDGTYSIVIQPNQVFDQKGRDVPAGPRGIFDVAIPWHFLVANTLDGPVSKAGDLPGSLRQAIFDANAAPTADFIAFDPVVFAAPQTIQLMAGQLPITDSVTIDGPGAQLLTLDAMYASRIFQLTLPNSILKTGVFNGMTLAHGRSTTTAGGAINAVSVNCFISNCIITDNSAPLGGAVNTTGLILDIENCLISKNVATNGKGGGIYSTAPTTTIRQSQIQGNVAELSNGGGIYAFKCTALTIEDTVVTGNESYNGSGGGILFYRGGKLSISRTSIVGNSASAPSFPSLASGGGLYVDFPLSSSPATNPSMVDILDSVLAYNGAFGAGGGAFFGPDTVVSLRNSTVDGNSAGTNGGGIYFYARGGFLVENSTVSHNTTTGATSTANGGGGIYFWGSPSAFGTTLRNSTISKNISAVQGGGIVLVNSAGTLVVQNSTITDNTAATNGGGIARVSGSANISLTSSLIANNHHATTPDISTTGKVTADHSLIGVTNGITTLTATASLTGTLAAPLDPLLAPLADNGGPTKTHVPLPGSPAINKGSNPLNLPYDQRGPGYPRQAGIAPDIGAFEFPLPPVVNAFVIGDGTAQRSMVRSVTVLFSEAVTFPFGPTAAFQLQRTGPGGPTGLVNLVFEQAGNVVTATFDDPVFAPGNAKSLIDGRYSLTLVASKIQGAYASLDGNGDGIPGDNQTSMFHRLYGDSDGDGVVSSTDWAALRLVYGAAGPAFDFNNDGVVSAEDFQQFRLRYGMTI